MKLTMILCLVIFCGLASVAGAGERLPCSADPSALCVNVVPFEMPSTMQNLNNTWQAMRSDCEAQMEAAMRAMDPYLVPMQDVTTYDGCNSCNDWGCTTIACTPGLGAELRRLEWEVAQTQRQLERERHAAEALIVWQQVKQSCWVAP